MDSRFMANLVANLAMQSSSVICAARRISKTAFARSRDGLYSFMTAYMFSNSPDAGSPLPIFDKNFGRGGYSRDGTDSEDQCSSHRRLKHVRTTDERKNVPFCSSRFAYWTCCQYASPKRHTRRVQQCVRRQYDTAKRSLASDQRT